LIFAKHEDIIAPIIEQSNFNSDEREILSVAGDNDARSVLKAG
jgi:hypothetical protein